jgi:hydroxyacylglutathione hydrolase
MRVEIVPCLSDNYAYVLTCEATGQSAIVDASDSAPVLEFVARTGKRVEAIWSTHHHHDHTGGNEAVAAALGVSDVVGHSSDRGRIPAQTRFVEHGDAWQLGLLNVRVLHIPGHTTGAVAYVVSGDGQQAVFTGDTLFVAGCGRLFEGTPEMMHASLARLSELHPATLVYCGHEYTEANLRFASHVEPGNSDVAAALLAAGERRLAGQPTVPSTVASELACNPFMRARDAGELGARRKAKDSFRS